jgi:hypothetical protein
MHVATYRLADLRTASTDLGPDVFEDEVAPALEDTLTARLADVCNQNGWNLIDVQVLPDRIEVLLVGKEADGENGETLAAAVDGGVYIGSRRCEGATMNENPRGHLNGTDILSPPENGEKSIAPCTHLAKAMFNIKAVTNKLHSSEKICHPCTGKADLLHH